MASKPEPTEEPASGELSGRTTVAIFVGMALFVAFFLLFARAPQ